MKPTKAYLDMDGVLVDFVTAITKAHGREYPYTHPSSFGNFDIEKIWGISAKEFWSKDSAEIWLHAEKTPESDRIVELVIAAFGVENITVVTSPSNHPDCVPSKKKWMRENYPQLEKGMVFCKEKHRLAHPGVVLIDDKQSNCDDFIKAGGHAILVPRPWNGLHAKADRCFEHVLSVLDEGLVA